jgi:hypothetical protein
MESKLLPEYLEGLRMDFFKINSEIRMAKSDERHNFKLKSNSLIQAKAMKFAAMK